MAERDYLVSHPWIDFELDLRSVRPDLWIRLGEIVRGAEILSGMPLDPAVSDAIFGRSLALGLHGMAALEGNLLERSEVAAILDPDAPDPGFTDGRAEEIKRIRDVIRYIHEGVEGTAADGSGDKESVWDLSTKDIAGFNRAVMHDGPVNMDMPGSPFRLKDISDMGYKGVPPGECEYLMDRLCVGLSAIRKGFPSGNRAVSGILRGIFAHAYIAWIMPFARGNCLTARIAEYQLMRSGGIQGPVLMLLEWYYNRTSRDYWDLLGRTGQKTGDLVPFIEYVLGGLLEAVSDLSRDMTASQDDVIWADYIRKTVSGQDSRISQRQQILIEEISATGEPVKIGHLPFISARVTRAYSGCSERTLARDVNILIELGLLERIKRTLQPRKETLRDHEASFKR